MTRRTNISSAKNNSNAKNNSSAKNISSAKNNIPATERDAGGGGDCFYFSLYAALNERALIQNIVSISSMPYPKDKKEFNRYFRNLIAEQIKPNTLATVADILYDALSNNSSKTLANDLDLQPWLIQDYINSKQNINLFVINVQRSIRQPKTEPQQIEIALAEKLLEVAGIKLSLVYKNYFVPNAPATYRLPSADVNKSMPFGLPLETRNGRPIVYLVMSRQERHYYYLSFHDWSGGRRIRRARKTRKAKRTKSTSFPR